MNTQLASTTGRPMLLMTVLTAVACVIAVASAAVAFTSGQGEARQNEEAIDTVARGLPEGVALSGTVNHTVLDGGNHVLGYVVNGWAGDKEVLCRAIIATEKVECIDLPVSWLYFEDAWK